MLFLTFGLTLVGKSINVDGFVRKDIVKFPEIEFFGSIKLKSDTRQPLYLTLGNGYALYAVPWYNAHDDATTFPFVSYQLIDYGKGGDLKECVMEEKISAPDSHVSLKIMTFPQETVVYSSGGRQLFRTLQIPPLENGDSIVIWSQDKNVKLALTDNIVTYSERKVIAQTEYYEAESGNHFGEWVYIDQVMPDDKSVRLGGRYTVKILPDSDDSDRLVICYVDGCLSDSSFWHEGDVKGYMIPTAFDNHYDVIWFDNHRFDVSMHECSATFEGSNLLTIDFPLLKAQIRFQRFLKEGNLH